MFRLLKLAVYALVGYAIYEMYQGMASGSGSSRDDGGGGGQRRSGGQNRGRGRQSQGNQLTGQGRGVPVDVQDNGGHVQTRVVGRGVTST